MTYSIVIAKYKENIDWVNEYIKDHKIYIYDKGGLVNQYDKNINVEYLNNIGRESHTYLYHIIKNYDNLTENVIFTQANYKDHVKNFKNLFKTKNCYFYPYPYFFIFPKNFRLKHFKQTPIEQNHEKLSFGDWFDKYINQDDSCDKYHFKIKFGAIFTIKKENILSRPKEYYINLLKQLENYGTNPEIGHFFERSWYYIFNCHKTPKYNIKGDLFSGY